MPKKQLKMRLTSCLYGLFLIAFVDSDSSNNWKSQDSTRKVLNRKFTEDIKLLSIKDGNNTRDITSEIPKVKEGSPGTDLELKDHISKPDITKGSGSLKKDTNVQNNVKSVFNDRSEIHHEEKTGTGREENVGKENAVNIKTGSNVKIDTGQELKTRANKQKSKETNSTGSIKTIRKELKESEIRSKVNNETGREVNTETNNKVNTETNKDEFSGKTTERKKTNFKGREKNKHNAIKETGDTKAHRKMYSTVKPSKISNNDHSSKHNLPPRIYNNPKKTEDEHIIKSYNDLKRKNAFNIPKPSHKTSIVELLKPNDEKLAGETLNGKGKKDSKNDNHDSTESEFEHQKAETLSKDKKGLDIKAGKGNNIAPNQKGKENSIEDLAYGKSDKQTTVSLPSVNLIKMHEENSKGNGQNVGINNKDNFLTHSTGTNSDEFDDFTTQSVDRTVSRNPISNNVTGNDSASPVSAYTKKKQYVDNDETKEQNNVTLSLSGDSLNNDSNLSSMKDSQYSLTTVKKINIIKEKVTEFGWMSKEKYPLNTKVSTASSAKTQKFTQNQSVLSFENEKTSKIGLNPTIKTAGNLQQIENQRTLNMFTKTDFENNLAEKSPADPCQGNVDTSRQYTGSAVIAAAVGGVFIGAFTVLVLFRLQQKCNKYINGDYRRVPMEYDFELNPRFKNN